MPIDMDLLLCFRATGQYWPLAFRQLALPIGSIGESFPYRRPFVFGTISAGTKYRALICMKYDKGEKGFSETTYIPLRWVQDCELLPGNQRDLLTFGFKVDATVHYDAVPSMTDPSETIATKHSNAIRAAVGRTLQDGSVGPLPDDDRALAILVERNALATIYPADPGRDDERWVNLSRLLSSKYLPIVNDGYFSKRLLFTRLSRVRYLDLPGGNPFDGGLHRFLFYMNHNVEAEVLSVSYPRTESRLSLTLEANPDEVTTVVHESSLYSGTWIHRFTLTPRAITEYSPLSFRVRGTETADVFATDFAVPVAIQPLQRMEVLDASDPNSIRCVYYVSQDRAIQPSKGAYLLADTLGAATRRAVVVVEDVQAGETRDSRVYSLRLIGTVDGSTVSHWDGATLAGSAAPRLSAPDLTTDVSPFLQTLCGNPHKAPGRCEVIQVAKTGPQFDLDVTKGFKNVHTAVFGQTGSGKSYSTGVILEELLRANFKLLVLDLNSDFIHFADAHKVLASDPDHNYQDRRTDFLNHAPLSKIRVFTNRSGRHSYWALCTLSFADLNVRQQAGLIHLDRDRVDLYAEHKKVRELLGTRYRPDTVLKALDRSAELSPESARRKLAALYDNYELEGMRIWADDAGTLMPALEQLHSGTDIQVMVVDLGSVPSVDARLLVAGHLLQALWALAQKDSKPIIIVVDEAHNLVTPQPQSELQVVTTEILNRIAAEGRKYGLNLLLMTQRPSKVHANCLGMISNLVCMKVTHEEDLGVIQTVFGNVPKSLFERIRYFSKGQALISGPIAPFPLLLRFGKRFTEEGIKEPA
jgi:hypothetical protein